MSMTNEEASNILRLLAAESLDGVSRFIESEKNRDLYKRAYEMAIKSLEESVPVVRCKDCKSGRPYKHTDEYVACEVDVEPIDRDSNFFCADGERRSE